MRHLLLIMVTFLVGLTAISALAVPASEVPRMTKEELKTLLGSADVVVFDVRTIPDYNGSKAKIKGAVRVDMTVPVEAWIDRYPKDRTFVFYCS